MKKGLFFLLCFFALSSHSQNLVQNPSFETYAPCPNSYSQLTYAPPWDVPSSGSADLFHTCAGVSSVGAPSNNFGFQQPRTGSAYGGGYAYYTGLGSYRECPMGEFTSPLLAGQTYTFEVWVSLGDASSYAVGSFGVYFSVGPQTGFPFNNLPFTPQISIPAGTMLNDTVNWELVTGTYTAAGGETHFIIGNFNDDLATPLDTLANSGSSYAYYYLDDVSMELGSGGCIVPNLLGADSSFCEGGSYLLDATNDSATYIWNNGHTGPTINATASGIYSVDITVGSCTFTDEVEVTVYGLPDNFLGDYIHACDGEVVSLVPGLQVGDFIWNTGSQDSTLHVTVPGLYSVSVTVNDCSAEDSIEVIYFPNPTLSVGQDTIVCPGTEIDLSISTQNILTDFLWSDGSISPSYTALGTGYHWVRGTDVNNCIAFDTMWVSHHEIPALELGPTYHGCAGETVLIDATLSGTYDYLWQNGSNTPTLESDTTGSYLLSITDSNDCQNSDSAWITIHPLPFVDLPASDSMCVGDSVLLDASAFPLYYLWNTGGITPWLWATQAGQYSVTISDEYDCQSSDSMQIVEYGNSPEIDLGSDTTLCEGGSVSLDAFSENCTYLWQDSSTSNVQNATESGSFWVEVTNEYGCVETDNILIIFNQLPEIFLGNDTLIPATNYIILNALNSGSEYQWSTGDSSQSISVGPGTYSVTVTNEYGCSSSDTIEIGTGIWQSIKGLSIEKGLIIYPNPSSEDQYLSLSNEIKGIINLSLFNVEGKILWKSSLNKDASLSPMNITIPTQSLSPGMYFLEVNSPQGRKVMEIIRLPH